MHYTDTQLDTIAHDLDLMVRSHSKRTCDFEWTHCHFTSYGRVTLQIEQTRAYTTLEYKDSGIGEEYLVNALAERYPGHQVEAEEQGGCDTCGHGRTVTITIVPPINFTRHEV